MGTTNHDAASVSMPMPRPPALPNRPEPREVHVVGAAIIRDGKCLVAQRSETMSAPLRWEFPGGKVEPGETATQALVREIQEELGVGIEPGAWLGRGTARAGNRRIVLDVYRASCGTAQPVAREHCALRWITAPEIPSLWWATADLPVLPALAAQLD